MTNKRIAQELMKVARELVGAASIDKAIEQLLSAIAENGLTLKNEVRDTKLVRQKYADVMADRDSLGNFVDSLQSLGVNIERLWSALDRKGYSMVGESEITKQEAAAQIVKWLSTAGGVKRFTSFRGYGFASERTATSKEMTSARSTNRFTLVLRKDDFRNKSMWLSLLYDMGIPYGEETDWNEPEEVELKVIGGKAY